MTTHTNYVQEDANGLHCGTQVIVRGSGGDRSHDFGPGGRFIPKAVEFEGWDDSAKMSIGIIVPWQHALEFLRKTGKSVTRIHWMDKFDMGTAGWSWGKWYKQGGLYYIGGISGGWVLAEKSFTPVLNRAAQKAEYDRQSVAA